MPLEGDTVGATPADGGGVGIGGAGGIELAGGAGGTALAAKGAGGGATTTPKPIVCFNSAVTLDSSAGSRLRFWRQVPSATLALLELWMRPSHGMPAASTSMPGGGAAGGRGGGVAAPASTTGGAGGMVGPASDKTIGLNAAIGAMGAGIAALSFSAYCASTSNMPATLRNITGSIDSTFSKLILIMVLFSLNGW